MNQMKTTMYEGDQAKIKMYESVLELFTKVDAEITFEGDTGIKYVTTVGEMAKDILARAADGQVISIVEID